MFVFVFLRLYSDVITWVYNICELYFSLIIYVFVLDEPA